jgi:hypothetical protein
MLYAHWEGFVKNAFTLYVEALSRTRTPRRRLLDCLVARSLQATLNRLSDRSIDVRANFVASLEQLLNANVVFEQPGINTKANLKTNVFRGLLADFGIYVDGNLISERTIDTLVDRRNDIAHGERTPIEELKTFNGFYDELRLLMEALAVSLDDSLDDESYVKPAVTM